ncbi:nuclear transport factor 2 family protein [Agromyces sp. G08B096]|uniref:Nuclear transport factor 2 family protein n=1 Tax=Agromyces sp. G08B096 TaxID=3156399 RepID=A0AAU7W6V4_9MICO
MTDPSAELARLIAIEELRSLQARMCRAVTDRDRDALDRCFTVSGQLRVYREDGGLACFATSPQVGSALDELLGDATLVVHTGGAEFTIRSDDRAEGVWSVEYVVRRPARARRGRGHATLHQTYERTLDRWLVRAVDVQLELEDG